MYKTGDDEDDDDDDDDDDDEFLLWNGWLTKVVKHYFQLRTQSEILTIANLWHAPSRNAI